MLEEFEGVGNRAARVSSKLIDHDNLPFEALAGFGLLFGDTTRRLACNQLCNARGGLRKGNAMQLPLSAVW